MYTMEHELSTSDVKTTESHYELRVEDDDDENEVPHTSDFKQQAMTVWKPQMTRRWVFLTYICVGVSCMVFGIALLVASAQCKEIRHRYDDICLHDDQCDVTIPITEKMSAPVYVYYELTNFFQNHQRYVTSRVDSQLNGRDLSSGNLAHCKPLIKYGDAFGGKTDKDLRRKYLYPCGLLANTMFNDDFSAELHEKDGSNYPLVGDNWKTTGIAWSSDRDRLFQYHHLSDRKFTSVSPFTHELINVSSEHLMVWMRSAPQSTFSKLYSQIRVSDLSKGSHLKVVIDNKYNTSRFDGEKWIVLSTSSWAGTRNDALGLGYIVCSCLCFILAAFYKYRSSALGASGRTFEQNFNELEMSEE